MQTPEVSPDGNTLRNRTDVSTLRASAGTADSPAAARIAEVRRLRSVLAHLEQTLLAQRCLIRNGFPQHTQHLSVQDEWQNMVVCLQSFVDGQEQAARSGNVEQPNSVQAHASVEEPVRVQLKLSPSLIRVLQAVRRNDVRASDLVECVLWESSRVQHAADAAGVARPEQTSAA